MEKQGLITKSKSPWAFPVVIVDKKGGEKRLYIDYRKLNALTRKDSYPIPRIDDFLESFRRAGWFTTLDLASGYWQVMMTESDKEKTAFNTPFGLYQFNIMPFGLCNAPGTFQRLMNHVLQDFLGKFVAIYLDDIIIYSQSFEQHIDHVKQVFQALREAHLKIKLKKCYFAMPNISFLGHIVGREGLRPDPAKVQKIRDFPRPHNQKTLRGALGLFGYYRKFIKDFSKIANPMNKLLKKNTPFEWTDKQQTAFDYLKERLTKAPILQYPDFDKEFLLYTDASRHGLGAVIAQKDEEGRERAIAYASRSLSPAEKCYGITDQECLAVVWAIRHFSHYLCLKHFTVFTDHSALKWLQTCKMPIGRRGRWIMELQQYDFSIIHRPGKANANADALSRISEMQEKEADEPENEREIQCFMLTTLKEPIEPKGKHVEICDCAECKRYQQVTELIKQTEQQLTQDLIVHADDVSDNDIIKLLIEEIKSENPDMEFVDLTELYWRQKQEIKCENGQAVVAILEAMNDLQLSDKWELFEEIWARQSPDNYNLSPFSK
jgi:hypothetical protein